MNPDQGFVDLRLNQAEGQNQESFWPSFTDIMTVIVMIFMIAMVILLLRNIELVRQLRATMEAERNAVALARSTGEEKESLALRLVASENELSMLRLQLMRLQEESQQQQSRIGSQDASIARLLAENEVLTLRRDQLSAERESLAQRLSRADSLVQTLRQDLESVQQQLSGSQRELTSVRDQLSDQRNQYQSARQQLAGLQGRYQAQSEELLEAKSLERQSDRRLQALRGEFDDLKVKYDDLVRPARSPEGRFLVEVRYSKRDGREIIEFASPEEPGFRRVERGQLEQRLAALKQEKKEGLYIKIIFPDKSGLSFNEAWSFTSGLHSRYDYYFRKRDSATESPGIPQE